jgi:WD40 repeat protein
LHECEGTEFFTSVTASNINGFSWAATSCTHLNGGNRLYVGSLSRIANVCQDFDETSSVCAFSPNKGHLAFAGSALHLLQMADDKGIQMVSKFKSDVLDMKYLDSNVLVLGCRNGLIKLLDLRAEPYRATDRFKHAGGVCKLQILSNSHQILAAGLRDISLYDLRNATRPYIRFEGGEQLENPDDVHVAVLADDSRIMAAQKTKLKLWSINGKYLDTFDHREDIHGIETSARDPLSCMISSRTGLHRVSIDVESGHKR